MNTNINTNTNMMNQIGNINSLLSQYQDQASCGPECQKERKLESLRDKYLDAQNNIEQGPEKLNEAIKNYYTYAEGEGAYEDYLERKYAHTANKIGTEMIKQFHESVNEVDHLNDGYNSVFINSRHIVELYKNILRENRVLEKELKENSNTVLTNDRKSFYENEGITGLSNWNNTYRWIYFFAFISLVISMFFITSIGFFKKILIILLFVIYPFVTQNVVLWFVGIVKYIYSLFPRNVYLTI